jgi:uncharacterized protein
MFLYLRDLERGPRSFARTFPPGELNFDEELRQTSPLEVEGKARLIEALGEIQIEGRLKVNVETDCDRCLEVCRYPIDTKFSLSYLPADTEVSSEEKGLDDDAVTVAFYEGDGIALEEVFREQVFLALPMQRLCREGCRGLCPVCGVNWNERTCECELADADDRWAALKTWKQ